MRKISLKNSAKKLLVCGVALTTLLGVGASATTSNSLASARSIHMSRRAVIRYVRSLNRDFGVKGYHPAKLGRHSVHVHHYNHRARVHMIKRIEHKHHVSYKHAKRILAKKLAKLSKSVRRIKFRRIRRHNHKHFRKHFRHIRRHANHRNHLAKNSNHKHNKVVPITKKNNGKQRVVNTAKKYKGLPYNEAQGDDFSSMES